MTRRRYRPRKNRFPFDDLEVGGRFYVDPSEKDFLYMDVYNRNKAYDLRRYPYKFKLLKDSAGIKCICERVV